ncbi:hypothetical protein DES44_1953 [Roseateles depolymerans]|uniref:Uncharacterized protein n=1 Tax=Roseateles depolymerans TaxID=76731 RepID=A0A0U3MU03_9BURK|nr:hypothetical protein RD2015_2007 [Roseateles depolymerans]REG19458.1 hypothetical protein DES44_1953 [Roseateles depolymerans]
MAALMSLESGGRPKGEAPFPLEGVGVGVASRAP